MQHLDEGTIHAWLDGALTPEEAAQADAHVKDCSRCQAAVAEARGFIAASSRILTALDDAPRGVIPIAPKQRVQPWVWRVAATVLVVATGTILLVKERGSESRSAISKAGDSAALFKAQGAGPPFATLPETAAAADSTTPPRATGQPVAAPAAIRPSAPPGRVGGVAQAPIRATAKQDLRAGNLEARAPAPAVARRADAPIESKADAVASIPATTAPTVPVVSALSQRVGVAGGAATQAIPREVGTRQSIGRTQTFYEVAPGDTVVLEEQSPTQLQGVVATGATMRAAQAPVRTDKSAAASVESQQKAEATPAAAPSPSTALQDAQVGERHSISWLDPSTRRVTILSGRHTQEELERIREQIQRLRAAQSKKSPE
jgi:hypothetical protein